ncbi:MAG: alanine--tRNA ligase [Flavisolibacter sp.]
MMMTSANVRNKFLEFFLSKQHHIVPSASIIIKNDPTLMFTNAGMNQFKDFFLGNRKAPFPRIANTQKCLRVSGKHNDLEEVGVDTYHHTMFEMLGNWSFGDYFKKEAIAWSWELLTKVLLIPENRLYVSVFEGDSNEGLPMDEEASLEWKKWIPADRIILGKKKDNFWEMGDTGPCGPCTEIHIDSRSEEDRKKVNAQSLINKDHPLVIEIWNNVFIQYNRLKNGSLEPLPSRHVDTGMGFERLVRVIQGKSSNYDTDIFAPTIQRISEITKISYASDESKASIALRVNADHIRAIAFSISDGQLPSNTGAGYVIRRILRRAVRYYYSHLNYTQPLLYQLVPGLADQFEGIFPELKKQQDFVSKVIRQEEDAFLRTLEKGLKRIAEVLNATTGDIEGKEAFELYDTYGFPLDLSRLIALEKNRRIDEEAFQREMEKQKERSRAAATSDASDWVILKEGNSKFIGYQVLQTTTSPLRYRKVSAKGKDLFQIVLEETPFYAESGGQVGDIGKIIYGSTEFPIIDTKKENELILHITPQDPGAFGGRLTATVDPIKRRQTAVHHSATHLLHAALKKVLGGHVEQKGSLVQSDCLRFDFSHFNKTSALQIKEVEQIVNEQIRKNTTVQISEMPKNEALKLGAMALFGEKYGEVVRVVTIDPSYSIELCGGTHVGATGELGIFKIISETGVAAGIRRIEAVSGGAAEQFIMRQLETLHVVEEKLKQPKDLLKRLEDLLEENDRLQKKLSLVEMEQLKNLGKVLVGKAEKIKGVNIIGAVVRVGSAEALKKLAFEIKGQLSNSLILLVSAIDGKASVVIAVDEALTISRNLDASALIKNYITPLIKGGGGGQKTLATAGGQHTASFPQLIQTIRERVLTI